MTPDIQQRVSKLERDVARFDERLKNLTEDLVGLIPLALDVGLLKKDILEVKEDLGDVKRNQIDSGKETRRALYTLAGVVITATAGIITTMIQKGGMP